MSRSSIFFTALILPILLFCQYSRVQITVDDQLLRSSEKQIVVPLQNEIKRFFTQTEFDQEYNDLGITLHVQVVFEGTAYKGSVRTFLIQALFSNGTDQRYFDKAVQFVFSQNQTLYYNPVQFEPLPSFLAFYGNLILAGEVDTYEPTGGTALYEQARTIAQRANSSEYSRGWSDRLKIVDDLSSNTQLRYARFHYYYADELLHDQNPERALEEFKSMMKNLDLDFTVDPRERYTLYFLKAVAPNLTKDLLMLNRKADLQSLSNLDPDNADVYLGRTKDE